jgi:hypothetical protein
MLETNAHPQSMAEEDANSVFSNDEGSSGEETAHNGSVSSIPRKRKREKHQKTSYVLLHTLSTVFAHFVVD